MIISSFNRIDRLVPHLGTFLGERVCYPPLLPWQKGTAVLAWGCKNLDVVRAMAEKYRAPVWYAEEGFLRSVGLGIFHVPPISVLLDKTGIYYDATRPSDLENLLENTGWESEQLLADARKAIALILQHDLSKFNTGCPAPAGLLDNRQAPSILLIDQTYRDMSIELGMADDGTFEKMLEDALENNPDSNIYIKTHPNVSTGYKKGYYSGISHPRVSLIVEDYTPLSLLAQADEVYVVSSQMGFEALLLNKKVHCYGVPFYSGWGVTHDRQPCRRRTRKRTVEEIFAAAYILYPRYLNTVTAQPTDIFGAIYQLTTQKARNDLNRGRFAAYATDDQRFCIKPFLRSTSGIVKYFRKYRKALAWVKKQNAPLALWNSRLTSVRKHLAEGVSLIRLEDGFIHSDKFGFNLGLPCSLIIDKQGIYFDPQNPSQLETLLREYDFAKDDDLVRRAAGLRQMLLAIIHKKHHPHGARFNLQERKHTILVVDQPEAIESPGPETAPAGAVLSMLINARRSNPEAFIVFNRQTSLKNRQQAISDAAAMKYADLVTHSDDKTLFAHCDELHTYSSFSGFVALLHGLRVHTHGGPFYAGWGLTIDRQEFPRRKRELLLDELVAGAMILYPGYYDWFSRQVCTPEDVLSRLESPPGLKYRFKIKIFNLYRKLRKIYLKQKALRKGWHKQHAGK